MNGEKNLAGDLVFVMMEIILKRKYAKII